MPRRRKLFKTKKEAAKAVHSFYKACISPDFDLFNASHYKAPDGKFYGNAPDVLERFDQPTADFLKRSFIHWIKAYHGEAFEAINPEKDV